MLFPAYACPPQKTGRQLIKMLLFMKFFILFFVVLCSQAQAGAQGQTVTINSKNLSFQKVFREIGKQTGYRFFYADEALPATRNLNLDIKDKQLSEVLDYCFRNTTLTYTISEDIIFIKRTTPKKEIDFQMEEAPARIEVRGRITDAEGQPLHGATVLVKGTSAGVESDVNGEFVINADPGATLVVSFIGHQTSEVRVTGPSFLTVTLQPVVDSGEEVVVVGFGTQKKSNLTGSVSEVKGEKLESRMSPNIVSGLQGLVPNLNVTINNSGGEPGATPSFNIRGTGSLSGGEPFVLVDGVPQNMNSVNPYDVESISVLKDASASAIYGVRAAYGVILITTKKGASTKPRISYNGNIAAQTPTKLPRQSSSVEFAETTNLGYTNAGLGIYFPLEAIEKMRQNIANPGSYPLVEVSPANPNAWASPSLANTDSYQEFYKKYATNHQHNLNISGGSRAFNYFLSGGYQRQGSQYRYGNEHFDRYTLTANISSQVTEWLNVSLRSKYTNRALDMPHVNGNIGNFYHDVPRRWPMYPVFDPNGHFFINTFAMVADGGRDITRENQMLNSLSAEISLTRNWKINADMNFRHNFSDREDFQKIVYNYNPLEIPSPDWTSTQNTYRSVNTRNYFNSNNLYTTYDAGIGRHNFKIMAGAQSELNRDFSSNIYRPLLISDNVPFFTTATGNISLSGGKAHWATLGYFGRFNYNFDERILFEFSSRYDGTSRFQEGRRWGFFPSFSAGYNMAREKFWGSLGDKIQMFKFRVSYGSLGNQAVSTNYYPYLSSLRINNNLSWPMGSSLPLYITAPGLVSPDITWETATTTNFGLDVEALQNRLVFSLDIYKRITDNMFGPVESLPNVLGATAPLRNNASLSTRGFELALGWRDRVGELGYHANFILSDNLSTVTQYRNLSGTLTDHYIGKKLGEIWGYTTVGIYQTADEVNAGPDQTFFNPNWASGDIQYLDINKDGRVNNGTNTLGDHGDLSIIGNSTPRYSYSLSLGAEWRGFYIDMLWQGVAKRDIFFNGNFFWGVIGDINQSTIFKDHLDYWTPDNTDAYFPRPLMTNESYKNTQPQTRYLQNAAYLRLKNLQIGYTLPPSMTEKFGVGSMRVYFTGENVLTFTKLFNVFDPEGTAGGWGQGKLYPLSKVYSLGLSLNLK